jgi:hypothetical protein
VDLSQLKPGDWLIVVGAAAMLIFGLALDWASAGPLSKNNAFDYFLTGGIAWILVVGSGVVTFVIASGLIKAANTRWRLIILFATGVATALMILRLVLGAGDEPGLGELDRAQGMYISFLAAAVTFAGAISTNRTADEPVHEDY